MTRFHKLFGAAAVFGLAVACGTSTTVAQDERMAKLELKGGYTIVKGERDGEPIPAERIKGAIIRFTDDETRGTDKDKKDLYIAKYKLDTSKTPWKIYMTTVEKKDRETGRTEKKAGKDYSPEEASTTGLIKKDGDTIQIIYALPGGKEPTSFKTKKGDKTQMFWLKNQNKGTKKRGDGGD
jgi:uncharacterized protein (TIGR03067 family)